MIEVENELSQGLHYSIVEGGKMDIADATYSGHINSKSFVIRKFLSKLLFLSTALTLILIAGLRPVGLDRDFETYATYIQSVIEINLLDKEPAFWLIKWINDTIFNGNVHTFFLIFALLGVSIKFLAIKKLSRIPWLSIVAYVSMFFILHEMTQIRAGVAAGIFLLSIPDIYNRNLKGYILKTVLATSFHYSAIIMAPLYFLNPKKISPIYLLLPIIGLFLGYINFTKLFLTWVVNVLPEFLAYKINLYLLLLELGKQHSEINILNFYYSSWLLILYFTAFHYLTNKIKSQEYILFIKILAIMLTLFYFLSPMPVFAFRIAEFLGVISIILIPNFVFLFKQKKLLLPLAFIYLIMYFPKTIKLLNWRP